MIRLWHVVVAVVFLAGLALVGELEYEALDAYAREHPPQSFLEIPK